MSISAILSGTGRSVPDRILTNADLEKIVDTSDEWITTRTGIKERRIAADDEALSVLEKVQPRFPGTVRLMQLRALALARRGMGKDFDDAQNIPGIIKAEEIGRANV